MRLWHNKKVVIGMVIVALVLITAVAGNFIAPHDPFRHDFTNMFRSPGRDFPFGTDQYGRDILSRVIWGSRVSLIVGTGSVLVSGVLGITLGLVSGLYGGQIDSAISGLIDVIMSFPPLLIAIAVVAFTGAGTGAVLIALGVAFAPRFARIIRGQVLAIREVGYVEAARASGAGYVWIMFKHVLPNIAGTILVLGTLYLPYCMLAEASLSFLGFGVSPDTPTWGKIISDGRNYLQIAYWTSIFPGIALILAVLGFNLLGDGLRDVLDPKLRD